MEKFKERKKNQHLVFIDLEKAYDKVSREVLWRILEKKEICTTYIQVIKDMYEGAVTSVRTQGGLTKDFSITVGLHQGSTLSSYLFALIVEVMTGHIQDEVPWCMLFADDIVLIEKTKEGAKAKLELWRNALESKGFHLNRSITEYMECTFSQEKNTYIGDVIIGDQIVKKSERFRYLGSIIQNDDEIDNDVISRIQAGWVKWRNAFGVLCDRKSPSRIKGKFCKTVVRSVMIYGAECLPAKKKHTNKINIAEMRMLWWMCGYTRKDRMRNEYIQKKVGVAPIEDKLRESRLRWFGHLNRRPIEAPVRKIELLNFAHVQRGRGRPKKTWQKIIRSDLSYLHLDKNLVINRAQ
ncbi:ataxia telangiectasia mutated family protein [Apostasia shenzhenica]|uniref:Ataxia telangiectasia mutated family protein n=1 Tax=Apostasia shenzhenica TaxID=1088818 RepID=A0A2I0ANM6_9ASPA|nr:ataxia telangiectasia mutated family protein [Apostasia shenzhenica]